MKINLWGLDPAKPDRWVKATSSYEARDQKEIFEKASASKWLLLLEEVNPNFETDLSPHLKSVLRLLAALHPGIILYGMEISKGPINLPVSFWETIGNIGNYSEAEILQKKIDDLQKVIAEKKAPKAVPTVIKAKFENYQGKPASMIPDKIYEKLERWYNITIDENGIFDGTSIFEKDEWDIPL